MGTSSRGAGKIGKGVTFNTPHSSGFHASRFHKPVKSPVPRPSPTMGEICVGFLSLRNILLWFKTSWLFLLENSIPFPLLPGVSLERTLGRFRSCPSGPKRISLARTDICTCLKGKRLLLNNLPPAAIWADTLSTVILLDTEVWPKKRRVVKGTRGTVREKVRVSSLHSCLCTFRKRSGERCVGARANSPGFFKQRSTHEASFHGSPRG